MSRRSVVPEVKDEYEYLREGFDANTLKIPVLRGLHNEHGRESLPPNPRKADWVAWFNHDIVPRRAELLARYEGVDPEGRGIVDAAPPRRARSKSPVKKEVISSSKDSSKGSSKDEDKVVSSPKKNVRSTRTRSMSPGKGDVEVKPQPSPTRRARKTDGGNSSSGLSKGVPVLAPPIEEVEIDLVSGVNGITGADDVINPSPSPRKSRKLKQPYINQNDFDTKEKQPVSLSSVSIHGTSPKKSIKIEDKDLLSEPSTSSSSPFSSKNYFQKEKDSPFSQKKSLKRSSDGVEGSKNIKKRNVDQDITPSKDAGSVPYFTPNIPASVGSVESTPSRGNVQIPHYTSFPTTPEEAKVSPVIPATAPQGKPIKDYSFPRPSTSIPNKRLSFMPDYKDLRISQEFAKSLEEEKKEREKNEVKLVFEEVVEDEKLFVYEDDNEDEEKEEKEEAIEIVEDELEIEVEDNDKDEVQQEPTADVDEKISNLQREIDIDDKIEKSKSKSKSKSKFSISYILLSVLLPILAIFSLAGYTGFWFIERTRIGYCDVGFSPSPRTIEIPSSIYQKLNPYITSDTLNNVEDITNLIIEKISPSCVECPEHAVCYPHFTAVCKENFVLVESLISLNGLLPFKPTCVPDMAKRHKVAILAKRAIEILNKKYADVICGRGRSAEVTEDDLRSKLLQHKLPSLSEDEFNELWRQAVKEIGNEPDIIIRDVRHSKPYTPPGGDTTYIAQTQKVFQSKSMAQVPLICRYKVNIADTLSKYKSAITFTILLSIISSYAYFRYSQYKNYRQKVNTHVEKVIQILVKQQKAADADTTGQIIRYVRVPNIQKILFKNEVDYKLWKDIANTIENTADINSRTQELRGGEVSRTWEYTGDEVVYAD